MKPLAKFGGATGNFHTLELSDAKVNWLSKTNKFLSSFKVEQNPITTQIEPHDGIAEIAHCIQRINNIIIDLDGTITIDNKNKEYFEKDVNLKEFYVLSDQSKNNIKNLFISGYYYSNTV